MVPPANMNPDIKAGNNHFSVVLLIIKRQIAKTGHVHMPEIEAFSAYSPGMARDKTAASKKKGTAKARLSHKPHLIFFSGISPFIKRV
jgi:hypothetical protein